MKGTGEKNKSSIFIDYEILVLSAGMLVKLLKELFSQKQNGIGVKLFYNP